jgi:outer membrane protein
MKKTFYTLGAIAISASMVFTACNSSNGTSEAASAAADSTSVVLAPAGSIVYVDMTKLMSEYQMAIDLSAEAEKKIGEMTKTMESKVKSIETEIKRKQDKLTKAANDFQEKYSKGLFTQSTAEVKAQELQQMEIEYNQYLAQKDQEIQQEQAKMQNIANEELLVMNNTVNDAINTFIAKYNQEKKFAMILLSQGDIPNDGATTLGTPVLTADPALDITADVVAGLNAEYNASK